MTTRRVDDDISRDVRLRRTALTNLQTTYTHAHNVSLFIYTDRPTEIDLQAIFIHGGKRQYRIYAKRNSTTNSNDYNSNITVYSSRLSCISR